MKYLTFTVLILCILLGSCRRTTTDDNLDLVQIQIVDQNNQTETVSSYERLQKYKSSNFLNPQPYKKVIRYFSRNSEGHVPQQITSYYSNGQVKQYLEAIDFRACGAYKEWHENGNLKIKTTVIGGKADFSTISQREWLFDGVSSVYDDKKNLIAEVKYKKGKLEGESKYYYENKAVKSLIPYSKNKVHGHLIEYYPNKNLKKKFHYKFGNLDGVQLSYWDDQSPLSIENYSDSKLQNGIYYKQSGKVISEINNGSGTRFIPINNHKYKLEQYENGIQQGPVHIYSSEDNLLGVVHYKSKKKHGREIFYYNKSETTLNESGSVMRYCIDWVNDKIHGNIKTWYPNGVMESQKQFANNKKNGPSLYWYKNGTLMSVEEYEHDKLLSGKYFKKNSNEHVSEVKDGNGTATLFDEDGILLEKITYQNGSPVVL